MRCTDDFNLQERHDALVKLEAIITRRLERQQIPTLV